MIKFEVEFIEVPEIDENICNYCEKNKYTFWCEQLVIGYCKECIEEVQR